MPPKSIIRNVISIIFLSQPFNFFELEFAIKNNLNTSPGYDDIKYPMLFHLPYIAKQFLIDMLKKVIVVSILKPGKDPNRADSYQPISLLSCVFKTLEMNDTGQIRVVVTKTKASSRYPVWF